MKIVINLPDRVDRRRDMERELRRVDWEAVFLPGVKPPDAGTFPSVGARGCFLSHLEAIELASRLDVSELFLIEDDLALCRDFAAIWPEVKRAADQSQWSIFYPAPGRQTSIFYPAPWQQTPCGLVELAPTDALVCAHLMIIRGEVLPLLIDKLRQIMVSRPMGVDDAYNTIRAEHPDLKTLCHWPPLGDQRSSRSDITPNRLDNLLIARPALSFARRVKNRLRGLL